MGHACICREVPGRHYPLGDLAAGEFVLFVPYLFCGLALPISPFFLLLLEVFGVTPQVLPWLKPILALEAVITRGKGLGQHLRTW
jgi:hypothetical protein